MKQVVFGMIGVGGIAHSQHLPNSTRAPHVKLKTVCDLKGDLVAEVQKQYDVPEATTDHKRLLADPEIQAVIVATREDAQARLTVEALQAGKHVYVEKPLAETPQQAEQVVAARRQSGKFVAVGFNRRFAPAYRKAREVLRADGGPRNIHYRISDDYFHGWRGYHPPGVRIIHEICHIFDILRWLTDSEIRTVYCVASRPDDEIIVMTFDSGCVASITDSGYVKVDFPKERLEAISDYGAVTVQEFFELRSFGVAGFEPVYRFLGHSHPDREYMGRHVLGGAGSEALYALRRAQLELDQKLADPDSVTDPHERAQLAYYRKYHESHQPLLNYMGDKGWIAALDHFAECVLTGRTPENASAEDACRTSLLSEAAIRSRDTGQIVTL